MTAIFAIAASTVFDPVFDLIGWLDAICACRAAEMEIDEEGAYVGLSAQPDGADHVLLRVWQKHDDARPELTGRIRTTRLLHAFHHALLGLLASADYAPDHWGRAPEDVDYWTLLHDRLAASPVSAWLLARRGAGDDF